MDTRVPGASVEESGWIWDKVVVVESMKSSTSLYRQSNLKPSLLLLLHLTSLLLASYHLLLFFSSQGKGTGIFCYSSCQALLCIFTAWIPLSCQVSFLPIFHLEKLICNHNLWKSPVEILPLFQRSFTSSQPMSLDNFTGNYLPRWILASPYSYSIKPTFMTTLSLALVFVSPKQPVFLLRLKWDCLSVSFLFHICWKRWRIHACWLSLSFAAVNISGIFHFYIRSNIHIACFGFFRSTWWAKHKVTL